MKNCSSLIFKNLLKTLAELNFVKTTFFITFDYSPKSLIMKSLSFRKVAGFIAAVCLVAFMALTFQNCTKAPAPNENYSQLLSSTMPPMSGNGPYDAQLLIWRAYTNSFEAFSVQHRSAESLTMDLAKGVSSIQNIVMMKFGSAAKALFKLDSLFVENIWTMTNGNPPAAMLTEIVPVEFPTYKGSGIFLNYMNSWVAFKTQINAVIKKANTQTPEGKELRAAADDFVTKVNSCTTTMLQLR